MIVVKSCINLLLATILLVSCTANKRVTTIEYALLKQKDSWLHHPVYGDPSWDNFIHDRDNPVTQGTPGTEWPVNGFLFLDPVSGCEYLYGGVYSRNYAFNLAENPENQMRCIGYRSCNRGKSWDSLGYVLPFNGVRMKGEKVDIGGAPDVSVVYDNGRYHMIFDWLSRDFAWNNAGPSGIGYAVADKPEGPFIIDPNPVFTNYKVLANPILGKYNRAYAASLIRRKNDWMVLFMLDSGENFSWAFAAITAKSPGGPWSEPVIINSVESPLYYPVLLEYFPAFTHEGYLYAPATSVAMNRNYQAIFRCKVEKAHNPSEWELWRDGSNWHSLPLDNEYEGIWGQTITGFIDHADTLRVMFPSLNSRDLGTLNLASRSWSNGYRQTGFMLSGHKAPSISYIYQEYRKPVLNITFKNTGDFSVIFDALSPLGPDAPTSNSKINPLMFSDQKRIGIKGNQWELAQTDRKNEKAILAHGTFPGGDVITIKVDFKEGKRQININGKEVWTGSLEERGGHIGLSCGEHSSVEVSSFQVKGEPIESSFTYLFTELQLGAGTGISKPAKRLKLNFTGTRFTLLQPEKPATGKIRVKVDGDNEVVLDTRIVQPGKNGELYESKPFVHGKHAVEIELLEGILPVERIKVKSESLH